MRTLILASFLSSTAASAFAAPPPPPPEYIADAAQALTAELTPKNFESYTALFADDTHVNGSEVAANKAAWLTMQKMLIGKVDRKIIGYSEGADDVFVVDRYDDRSALPTAPDLVFDARYVTRAER